MGGTGKNKTSERPGDNKPQKPAALPREEEQDYEDGDFATPKRDRNSEDDQPL
jgi:hypothetical protein